MWMRSSVRSSAEWAPTITNAALLRQEGKLGKIAAGACADLLIVDGDPLTDLRVMLVKEGIIYKNELN